MNIYNIFIYILSYLLFAGFFVIERFVRRGKDVKKMGRTAYDRGSTVFISVVMGAAFIILPLSPLLNWLGVGVILQSAVRIPGLVLGAGGLTVRYVAFTTLGRFFSRTLRKAEDHALVTGGIYKYIRHPGYLSDFMIFIGIAMSMGNLIALVLITVTFVPAYAYRIRVEEKMLIEIFDDQYREYIKTSKRLIPFIL